MNTGNWLLEIAEDKTVHDQYGDAHIISSSWIREKGNAQNTIYRLLIDGKDITQKVNEVEDHLLRKQIKNSVGYGKMTIVKVEEMK